MSTQAIWSCVAESAPCICGSDTLAMVTVIAYRKVTAVQVPSTSARRSAAPAPVSSASGIACALIGPPRQRVNVLRNSGRPRLRPVSTVTVTVMPARSGG